MRVLVAAADGPGERARATLADAGFVVERVERLAEARVRAATAPVAVVGPLADAPATDLRDALDAAGARTPLVGLDPDAAGYTTTVDGPADDDLPVAVRLARHTGAYRDAVDDLYERCRAAADGDDPEVAEALARADESLADARRVAGRTPYDYLLD
ncbi:hypothetical protein [Halosegnis marinus]|uniref:Uncharacterized protein n=1 Tax=Halosegnis marinus TaxID=3034023 RepID=A0ABD5ZM98_9EURY|nr:hypothetical protein [Halosegnis sp. DT85]